MPSKNLYGKEKNFDYLTYAFKVNKYNLTQDAKAALMMRHEFLNKKVKREREFSPKNHY